MEQSFASPEIQQWVRDLQEESAIDLSDQSKVLWMEVRDRLKRASDNDRKPAKQIVFEGEWFDVMSARCWRDKVLAGYAS